jgi:hypothetical protein
LLNEPEHFWGEFNSEDLGDVLHAAVVESGYAYWAYTPLGLARVPDVEGEVRFGCVGKSDEERFRVSDDVEIYLAVF